jgi:hypothetical protein
VIETVAGFVLFEALAVSDRLAVGDGLAVTDRVTVCLAFDCLFRGFAAH